MTDETHPVIRAKMAEIEQRRRELEILEAELRGMQYILSGVPMKPLPAPPSRPKIDAPPHTNGARTAKGESLGRGGLVHKGRQPGAISHQWRDTLAFLYMNYEEGFSEYAAATAAQAAGLPNVKPKDALERLNHYLHFNYVEKVGEKFRVTDVAVKKYGFLPPAPKPRGESSPQ